MATSSSTTAERRKAESPSTGDWNDINQRYKLEQVCQLNTSSQISVARVSFLLSSEGNWQENKKHGQLYLKKRVVLGHTWPTNHLLGRNKPFFAFLLGNVYKQNPLYSLFSEKETFHCYDFLSFNSTFSLFLKTGKLQKEVNRRQVKPGVLNSPRPRLRGAQMVLFL